MSSPFPDSCPPSPDLFALRPPSSSHKEPGTERCQAAAFTIAIVGLGYVGLPLLLAYARKGYPSIGFDIDPAKPAALLAGRSYIKHIPQEHVAEALSRGNLDATTNFFRIAEADAVILCVPTPLDVHLEPDLSYVRATLDAVVPHLKPGSILSLDSTTYPGTTAEDVVPRVVSRGLIPGESVFVVYSPEREDPGNTKFHATNIPKVVGGHTAPCLEKGVALYEAAFEQVVPVSSTQVAELSKLLENIYRAVNISLANKMKIVADAMGIDIWEVIRAAATKPFGFTPFYPGPGLAVIAFPSTPSTSPGRLASLASTPASSNLPARSTARCRTMWSKKSQRPSTASVNPSMARKSFCLDSLTSRTSMTTGSLPVTC